MNGNRCFCSSLVLELKTNSAICSRARFIPGCKRTFQFGQKHSNETRPGVSLYRKGLLCKDFLLRLSEMASMIIWRHLVWLVISLAHFNISAFAYRAKFIYIKLTILCIVPLFFYTICLYVPICDVCIFKFTAEVLVPI